MHVLHTYREVSRKHLGGERVGEGAGLDRHRHYFEVRERCLYDGCSRERMVYRTEVTED